MPTPKTHWSSGYILGPIRSIWGLHNFTAFLVTMIIISRPIYNPNSSEISSFLIMTNTPNSFNMFCWICLRNQCFQAHITDLKNNNLKKNQNVYTNTTFLYLLAYWRQKSKFFYVFVCLFGKLVCILLLLLPRTESYRWLAGLFYKHYCITVNCL